MGGEKLGRMRGLGGEDESDEAMPFPSGNPGVSKIFIR